MDVPLSEIPTPRTGAEQCGALNGTTPGRLPLRGIPIQVVHLRYENDGRDLSLRARHRPAKQSVCVNVVDHMKALRRLLQ